MIFRLSQKLYTKIKAGSLSVLPLEDNPFSDWSAHLFVAGRTQYILLSNTSSLYPTVMRGGGITNKTIFIDHALGCVREFTEADGHESVYRRLIYPESGTIRISNALNRSVTGSMTDMIRFATAMLVEDEMPPRDIGFKLNDIPFSWLKQGTPRRTFRTIVSEHQIE